MKDNLCLTFFGALVKKMKNPCKNQLINWLASDRIFICLNSIPDRGYNEMQFTSLFFHEMSAENFVHVQTMDTKIHVHIYFQQNSPKITLFFFKNRRTGRVILAINPIRNDESSYLSTLNVFTMQSTYHICSMENF